ncbi:MAG: hypothetical protein WC205_01335 [Opitutaceae bacterium]|jgi:hypothetical protein
MILRRLFLFLAATASLHAWNYEAHRTVNQLALAGLPEEFPAFTKTPAAAERIAFLAGEPDRWRSTAELSLKHVNGPDHYLDFEYLDAAGLPVATLSEFRYIFAAQLAEARAAHPEKFAPINADKNKDHTRELIGFLPWSIIENYAKLKSAFSYLRAYEEAGTPEEVANAQANIIYLMGLMGHYVGDGAQPLHTTMHNNGWVGDNPQGYTRSSSFHAWIDGGFIALGGLNTADLAASARPAHDLGMPTSGTPADARSPIFDDILIYLVTQHARVEPLYQLDKTGALKPNATDGGAAGRAFIGEQLLCGGEMLSSLWFTAWKTATPDIYLRAQLFKRQSAAKPAP